MIRVLVSLFVLTVTACVSKGPEPLVGQSGKMSYSVECLGEEKDCYPQAQGLCPKGYVVTYKKSRVMAIWQGADVASKLKHNLTIECSE